MWGIRNVPGITISEKYRTTQSHKLHVLQNSLLVQVNTPASDCKVVRNIPGNHFVRAFSARPWHS